MAQLQARGGWAATTASRLRGAATREAAVAASTPENPQQQARGIRGGGLENKKTTHTHMHMYTSRLARLLTYQRKKLVEACWARRALNVRA